MEQLETLCFAGLSKIRERRAQLAQVRVKVHTALDTPPAEHTPNTAASACHEHSLTLAQDEERERQKRLDCAVCLSEPRAVAYVPCGHIACCRGCAPKVDLCPLCKRSVGQRIPVYLP